MPVAQLKGYCFAHQPILGPDNAIVAMELLYRNAGPEINEPFDHTAATANVIISAFSHIGMIELMGDRKLFINVAEELLLSDTITLLPKEKVTLELLEHIEVNEEILARVRQLKDMGYEFALDDYIFHADPCPLFELVDIIKVDIIQSDLSNLNDQVRFLRQWPCKLLAEKVETQEIYQLCKDAGFDLFQGYFFAHPTIIDGKLADPHKLAVLNLLSKVMADAEFDEIEAGFKCNPALTYSLLRLVNSPAFYSSSKIESIRQAINVLGLTQLGRWLQVLLFTQQNEQECLPILELAVHRSRLMELMAEKLNISQERAYVCGMLSLADSAMGIPMTEIINNLNLVDEVGSALLQRQGTLGLMLNICEQLEQGAFETVDQSAEKLKLTTAVLNDMHKGAVIWSNQMLCQLFKAQTIQV